MPSGRPTRSRGHSVRTGEAQHIPKQKIGAAYGNALPELCVATASIIHKLQEQPEP